MLSTLLFCGKITVKHAFEWVIMYRKHKRKYYFVNTDMMCSRLALYCPWTQSRSALCVEHLKIFKTKAASDIWDSREILRCIILGENISVQIVQTPGHGWPEQDRQSSCTVQKGQNRMYFQNSLSVYTAARENTCNFCTFLHCILLKGQNQPERFQMLKQSNQVGQLCYQTQTGLTGGSATGCLA